jgi:uracil-DNA glycosylase family 4
MAAKKIIPGEGPKNAKIMLIGEAGGREEEKLGRPFVGRAGKFLDKQLKLHEIDRKKVYITNVVKIRCIGPPTDRQIKKYLSILKKELKQIRPKIIVLLGKTAARSVPINTDATYIELPHPSAAMRFTKMKRKFEVGMKQLTLVLKDL